MRVTAQMNPEVFHSVACDLIENSRGNQQMPSIANIKAAYAAMLRTDQFTKKEKSQRDGRESRLSLAQLIIDDWERIRFEFTQMRKCQLADPELFNALVSEYQYFFPQELAMLRKGFGLELAYARLWRYQENKAKFLQEAIALGLPSRTQKEIRNEFKTSPNSLRPDHFSKIPPQLEEIETEEESKKRGARKASQYLKVVRSAS